MNRNLLLLATLSLCASHGAAQENGERPNLLFIMADQWRGSAIGCLDKEPVATPNIDRLAERGAFFTEAMSSYPLSSPARGMLMTGMYPVKSKVTSNCNSESAPYGVELPETARCWSDVLSDNGYTLGYIGKWHLDAPHKPYINTYNNHGKVAWNEWTPKERRHGFTHWIAYGTYDYHLRPMYWTTDDGRDDWKFVDQWGPEFETDRAIEYLKARGGERKPFALVVSINPPHTGYDLVPERYKERYKGIDVETLCTSPLVEPKGTEYGDFYRKSIRDYYAAITGVDEQIGRLLAALEEQGLAENTIVVFTSDHGDCMGMHKNIGKDVCYEEAIRVPMILSWPGHIPARRDDRLMIAYADLYPTLLSLMGLKAEIPAEVETRDLSAEVTDPEKAAATAPTLIQPYYKISPDNLLTGYRGLRTPTHTFALHATEGEADETLLFCRQTDPYELHNIASEEPQLVEEMTRKLKEWLEATDDPFAEVAEQQLPASPYTYKKGQYYDNISINTLSAPIPLPELRRGTFFARDDRPGDYHWPNNTNRLLPWTFRQPSDLLKDDYIGIASNGKPSAQGDAMLVETVEGDYMFVKSLSRGNTISWLQISADGTLRATCSTLGSDTLSVITPEVIIERGTTPYEAIWKAYEKLISDREASALQRREEKDYFDAFRYLGWCSWEHYHYDIDEKKMLNDINDIEASGLPVRYVLIDDGHITAKDRQLQSFVPDSQRFPNAWEKIISRKSEEKIKWMGLWYNFCGYWNGISADNDFPEEIRSHLYPYNGTLLPGRNEEDIKAFYEYYVKRLKDYGFDFLKVDNQAYLLPMYMGGKEAVRRAKACNIALEEATHQQGMGLINCMAQNTLNTDNTLYSNVARVSIDYKKYDENMAKSHLYQSYANTLLQGQTVWPDHDMFHSCDSVCGGMMAREKAMSGGPVYLSDSPKDFVKENILPLIDEEGQIFRPSAPAVPTPESILINPLEDGGAYRVFAPTGEEAMTIVCYNLNTSPKHHSVEAMVGKEDYSLRETMMGSMAGKATKSNRRLKRGKNTQRILLYDWEKQAAEELTTERHISLHGFCDKLFHLCPIIDGWGVVGIKEKYLSPATVRIVRRSRHSITLEALCPGTLMVWAEKGGKKELRSVNVAAPGMVEIRK